MRSKNCWHFSIGERHFRSMEIEECEAQHLCRFLIQPFLSECNSEPRESSNNVVRKHLNFWSRAAYEWIESLRNLCQKMIGNARTVPIVVRVTTATNDPLTPEGIPKRSHLPSIFATMKITIAPKKPPPANRYTSEYPAAAKTGVCVKSSIFHSLKF